MKKLVLAIALIVGAASFTFASSYNLNESAIDAAFNASEDVTLMDVYTFDQNLASAALAEAGNKKGYLVRAFFCGWTGMHRKYIGSGGKKLGWYYVGACAAGSLLSSFVVGLVFYAPNVVDFFGPIFSDDLWAKYQDNPKFMPWLGKD